MTRRWAHVRTDPAVVEATRKHVERMRDAHAESLARMRRVLIHAFPARKPEAIVLVDVGRREITTFVGEEIGAAKKTRSSTTTIIAAVDVRGVASKPGSCDPGDGRLAELGPPQKTKTLNRRGRTLKITTRLLVQGSCGISRPFGDEKVLYAYLRDGKHMKLRRRLEADAKSLFALYEYGRLHGAVRLRWGFLDEMIPAAWVHRDEPTLYNLMERAHELRVPLDVVVGSVPGWADPWACAQGEYVEKEEQGWRSWLVDEQGHVIPEDEVQLARLVGQGAS